MPSEWNLYKCVDFMLQVFRTTKCNMAFENVSQLQKVQTQQQQNNNNLKA
jgi:hypothetical protein